jgi:aspartate dehydrogenase
MESIQRRAKDVVAGHPTLGAHDIMRTLAAGRARRGGAARRADMGSGKVIGVGVVGLGAIGRPVCRALDAGIPGLRLVGALARDRRRAETFLAGLAGGAPLLPLDDLVAASDLIVEASTQAHLEEIAPRALGAGRDLVVLSCGGLLHHPEWTALAESRGARIHVPSGAIAGLDGVKGARVGTVTSVTMETRKPPAGLAGAPWIAQQGIDLDAIAAETLVFEGPATDAVRAFPANVNVVAALSLAGVGPERTRIRIFAVPGLARNTHRVRIEGEFGALSIEIENVPSENPRTGRLSYLSTIALLRDLGATLRVGS